MEELDRLLTLDEVIAHQLVYGELLIGDQGARRKFLDLYGRLEQAVMVPHLEVVAFARDRGLQGRGIGWIDVQLLASSLVGRDQLWTADVRLLAIAAGFGIAYQSSASSGLRV